MQGKISSDLLRGHTDTIILHILSKEDSYGYAIYNSILEKTGEQFELKEATLYASFKRLEKEGCIASYWGDESQGGRRKYYQITQHGREVLATNKTDWLFTTRILSHLFEEELS